MFKQKYVYMDMLPDGYGSYGGRRITTPVTEKKELSLQEQLKVIKEGEKPKEKNTKKYQIQL